jgi:hypothetical protein
MTADFEILTYDLRAGKLDSTSYYRDLASLADIFLTEAGRSLGGSTARFMAWAEATGHEPLRTRDEYSLDLLVLGVLWRTYARRVPGLPAAPRRWLAGLVRIRDPGGAAKALVDAGRGLLGGLFLKADPASPGRLALTSASLGRLIRWLEATGSFEQEVGRLSVWRDHLDELALATQREVLDAALRLAEWFAGRAANALGGYTPKVESFLRRAMPHYRWRADAVFCGRQALEYHLNMVAAEILNRAHRTAFLATQRRLVLVPPCMRAQVDGQCQAHETSLGSVCAACTVSCRVHQLTRLGEKRGFGVRILPDDLRVFSAGAPSRPAAVTETGIVGVSCALTNASGGWETRGLGIPAQGVLLDYCGCRYHWHDEGFATDLNISQLLRMLGLHEGNARGSAGEDTSA